MKNTGFHLLRWPPGGAAPAGVTVLVVGLGRSGTSVVIRLLRDMGLFVGDDLDAVTLEDARLGEAIGRDGWGFRRSQKVIDDYNGRFASWAFKHPVHNLSTLFHLGRFREARVVFVARDPVAVGTRLLMQRPGAGFAGGFFRAQWLNAVYAFLAWRSQRPALFLSYEKLLTQPKESIGALAQLAGLALEPDALDRLVAVIEPNDPAYGAKWMSSAKLKGYLDRSNRVEVAGWVSAGTDAPVRAVNLFINGDYVGTNLATLLRRDVLTSSAHPTGHCGFRFALAKLDVAERFGALTEWRVEVRDAATGMELRGSPCILVAEGS
jgi:hypothetical protein